MPIGSRIKVPWSATADASVVLRDPGTGPSEARGGFPVSGWQRYVFIAELGHGGMGSVYRARDPRLGRDVALKFIRGADPLLTMRLLCEARAQARIDHPNICKVFEVDEVDGKAYIAMELVAGRPLDAVAATMALHDKVQVIRDVALALHAAHKLGILHRDIKPSNILVEIAEDRALRPVLMDFGIARDDAAELRLTETGALLGTPSYMSPEQARSGGRALDRRSDVYSLGATLYEHLSGVPPFEGDSSVNIILAVLEQEPVPLRARLASIPVDLATIVAKCLHKDPGRRYDSALALADDLDRYIRREPILGRREGWLRRVRRIAGKHRALVATAALALVSAALLGGVALQARSEWTRQAELSRELEQDIQELEAQLATCRALTLDPPPSAGRTSRP